MNQYDFTILAATVMQLYHTYCCFMEKPWGPSRAVESESSSRKDFEPEESESQKILTTPTPG